LPVSPRFTTDCHRCQRLHAFLQESSRKYPDYHCKPVPSFGPPDARLLIVGLAPGLHGANATGRPFTGDYAGVLLYETLFRHGFASRMLEHGQTLKTIADMLGHRDINTTFIYTKVDLKTLRQLPFDWPEV
jgi:uracil-DNA glycosylase